MREACLIFPNQLVESNPFLDLKRKVYLVEEPLFFTQYKFHKQKLVFHRASMKAYQAFLERKGLSVQYISATQHLADVRNLIPHLKKQNISTVHYCDVVDNWLEKRIRKQAEVSGVALTQYDATQFMLSQQQVETYFKKKTRFHQTDFYTVQRKHFKILVDQDQKPVGGKWSFDKDNRLKYPKTKTPPKVRFPQVNTYWIEAVQYVNDNYADHYGEVNDSFAYPTTFEESRQWMRDFLKERFADFGNYEDAIVSQEIILHHSVLSPLINAGLLTPGEVLTQVEHYAAKHELPINTVEGFVRQVLGWREFIRGVYIHSGTKERTTNFWKFKRRIPHAFWSGDTGITPIDMTIKKVLRTGYCHHIERLMVLGNFMLLCEFDPDEVYVWFMSLFVDAYDWVMVPNVYGMGQFADGGLMATKPYISGSNYLMKMSDYEKGDWQKLWDGLFWRFMHTHRDFFLKNPRLGMLIRTLDKMDQSKKDAHLTYANDYLQKLDASSN